MSSKRKEVTPNSAQNQALTEAHIAFMDVSGFFGHIYYDILKEVLTGDIPSLATDGKYVYINPEYLSKLKVAERSFGLIHETLHAVDKHPQRAKYYKKQGNLRGLPWDDTFANICMDYWVNHAIVNSFGSSVQMNPEWLFDPTVDSDKETWEDIYERLWPNGPVVPQPPGQGGVCVPTGNGGQGGESEGEGEGKGDTAKSRGFEPKKWREDRRNLKGTKPDETAKKLGGGFDKVEEPPVNQDTGEEDLPNEAEYKEAIARAAEAQKNQGDAPAMVKRIIKEVLEPEIHWKDKLRLSVTGKMGWRGEDWARPNRRRLVLKPRMIIPGKKPYGAGVIVMVQDTSGSMGTKEEAAGLAELGAILSDVRPKQIIRLCCDACVGQVDYVRTVDDFEEIRDKGTTGGGGTDFRPPFEWVSRETDNQIEALIYVTDMMGTFPHDKPRYPVIWVSTSKPVPAGFQAPWGEIIEIDLKQK